MRMTNLYFHALVEPLVRNLACWFCIAKTIKDVDWFWDSNYNKCLLKIKHLVTSAAGLGLCDPTKPVTVSFDASQRDLGAVTLQNE